MVSVWDKAKELVACREMSVQFQSAKLYTDDTRSYRHPGAQFCVRSSRNWSLFLERP